MVLENMVLEVARFCLLFLPFSPLNTYIVISQGCVSVFICESPSPNNFLAALGKGSDHGRLGFVFR